MRPGLPTGTVTFVFTDIEGSTALLAELGSERYGTLLSQHHRVSRVAWLDHGGVEVDTAGDAFFVAFASPVAALAAADDAQHALAELGLRVRMGVHTGDVALTDTGYVGLEVHRAARIAAAAHGGQVLVSAATARLAGDRSPVPLVDLGEHRFKDLAEPARVFQLGDGAFPPIRSLYHSNLPVPATPFLGRERELAAVAELVARPDVRLTTLTGPGGTGKTRLALQAAAEAADSHAGGVWWVPLAGLRDPSLVASAVAAALGVDDEGARSSEDAVARRLAGSSALVVVDNVEHLLPDAAGALAALMQASPEARWLVTSRERLQLSSEHVYAVPELELDDAVALFVQRAAALDVDCVGDSAVVELCERLDRLPLALELAAARAALFAPGELVARLSDRLDLLRGGRDADPRQLTLRATIDWSHELLEPREQTVFRGLSAFAGGCTLEAAEDVARADPDTLQSLVDKSLVRRRVEGGASRFWMLETIREYAVERCRAEEESDAVRRRHADWVERVVRRGAPIFMGYGTDGWNERLALERENVRVALDALEEDEPVRFAELVGVVWPWWYFAGALREGERRLGAALALVDGTPAALPLLSGIVNVAYRLGDDERCRALATRELELAQRCGTPEQQVEALRDLGNAYLPVDSIRAAELYEQSAALARDVGHLFGVAGAAANLGYLAIQRGDWVEGGARSAEAAAAARAEGDDYLLQLTVYNQGLALLCGGDHDGAAPFFAESLRSGLDRRFPEGIVYPLEALAVVLVARGAHAEAARAIGAAAAMREATEQTDEEPHHTLVLGAVERARAALGDRWAALDREGRELGAETVAAEVLTRLG